MNQPRPCLTLMGVMLLVSCTAPDIPSQKSDETTVNNLNAETSMAEGTISRRQDAAVDEPATIEEQLISQSAEPVQKSAEPKPNEQPVVQKANTAKVDDSKVAVEVEKQKTVAPAEVSTTKEIISEKPVAVTPIKTELEKPKNAKRIAMQPNHFYVSMANKTPSHPQFGVGSAIGFNVDNIQGKELVVERGQTYYFNVDTNMQHDFYLSNNSVGWGGGVVTGGVKGQFTYRGMVTFKPLVTTPSLLYYQCRNHKGMGWKIHVINKGEKAQLGQGKPKTPQAVQKASAAINADQVRQKIRYANSLVTSSSTAKRVNASKDQQAKDMLKKAGKLIRQSKQSLTNNQLQQANSSINQALGLITSASRKVPARKSRPVAELEAEFDEYSSGIKSFKTSYQRTVKRAGSKGMKVKVDLGQLDSMVAQANKLRMDGKLEQANRLLLKAQRKLTLALNKMLASQTLSYELKFENPKEEYEYEVSRFKSYEELILLAIEQKQPKPGILSLIDQFAKKGRQIFGKAQAFAKKGDYKTATDGMQAATKELRRALRLVGV